MSKERNIWTEEEEKILKEYYSSEGSYVVLRLPNHTASSVRGHAHKLGLKRTNLPWIKEEDDILKEHYPTEGIKAFDRINTHSYKGCKERVQTLGLKRDRDSEWTKEEDDILKKYYPIEKDKVCKRIPKRTRTGIKKRVSDLGLSFNSTRWTQEEIDILKKCYPLGGAKEVQAHLTKYRTIAAIQEKASCFHITGQGVGKKPWSTREKNIIEKYYPYNGSQIASVLPGRSKDSIIVEANKLGINYIPLKDREKKVS